MILPLMKRANGKGTLLIKSHFFEKNRRLTRNGIKTKDSGKLESIYCLRFSNIYGQMGMLSSTIADTRGNAYKWRLESQ